MATYGTPATTMPMSPVQNHFPGAIQSCEPAPMSALDCLHSALNDSHTILDHLHALADRIVGIRGELAGNKPAPVPNGLLDENILTARAVQERLVNLFERLSPIA